VHGTSASLFLNGLEDDSTAFDTQSLVGPVSDLVTDAVMRIGQSSNEIVEVFSGSFPQLHTQSECRCPSSHPRVHPLVERYCIPNNAEDTTNNRVLRLNLDAHPLSYINDNDIGTGWISNVFSSTDQLNKGVVITFDLENGQYQVFYVILQFLSPQPEAVRIERRTNRSSEWRDWQYLAKNCSIFGMVDNGPLEKPDSVNCLQFPSWCSLSFARDNKGAYSLLGAVPYSRGNVTFSILTPEPNLRPGYNDFYNTPGLQEFVKASQVRIHLRGQYHTQEPRVPLRHRYYGVDEITISGRCDCHGHADHCDTSTRPYRCSCLPESHTQGDNCERCAPLFNDKPFREGDQVQAYSCRSCQCHGHASSCHYDITVDPFPGEHFRGGGGVCDHCQHNTTEADAALSAEDVCTPCECHEEGAVNSSLDCHPIGGQCKCKRHVSGRQCNQCQHGFYKLQRSHPDGCRACNCNTAGTVQADITCHQDSGQCQCKANVIGVTCDRCNFGFKYLNSTNPDGCAPCGCNRNGSSHQFCDPFSGQCECRAQVQGLQCDTCAPDFYGLTTVGTCLPCDCDPAGTIPGGVCDSSTGQCPCKPHAEGRRCQACHDGFYGLDRSNSLGCLPCRCDPLGSANATNICDKSSGECPCKANIQGPRCTRCAPHSYDLTSGCRPCQCDPEGTVPGMECDQASGQCVCLPARHGQNCAVCQPGFFLSSQGPSGCESCDCHPVGALGHMCEVETGQCSCRHPSLTGRNCRPCGCDPAGSFNGSCHPETGRCLCKQFVTGDKCDTCVPGASHMDTNNHLGCSKAPSQQPPPTGTVLSSRTIRLIWSPPDSPNSNELTYTLLRDAADIHTVHSFYPFDPQVFEDSDLSAYTVYSYHLVTRSVHGQTSSEVVRYRTLSGVPRSEELQLSLVGRAGPSSATFNWTAPRNSSGPVEKYVLRSTDTTSREQRAHYTGLQTEASAAFLTPFTRYNFTLEACTNGGCAQSDPITLVTAQVPPQGQAAPRVSPAGPTKLQVDWDPPVQPNGVVIRYDVFMRGPIDPQKSSNGSIPERRVFFSSGWLNPLSVLESANGNALTPPHSSALVSDLQPFSSYQFRVLTVNMAGSVLSDWTTGRTAEG
ncbi:hypothetical protein JZ751_002629, partial [Albula glossodonta]